MAATVYLQEWNGTSGSEIATSKQAGTVRFKSADDAVVDASAPLIKPNAGVYRSYEKYLRTHLEALGGSTEISNVEVFCASTPIDGISIWAKTAAAYDTPLSGGYSAPGAMVGPKEDLFVKNSDDPIILGAGPYDSPPVDVADFLVLQMECYPSATIGALADTDIVLRYDEE